MKIPLLTHESENYHLSRSQSRLRLLLLAWISLCFFSAMFALYTCEATSASSTFRRLEVQHFFRKSVVSYSSHLICLYHIYLLWVFSMLYPCITSKAFPFLLSVQSLFFNPSCVQTTVLYNSRRQTTKS